MDTALCRNRRAQITRPQGSVSKGLCSDSAPPCSALLQAGDKPEARYQEELVFVVWHVELLGPHTGDISNF